MQYKNSIVISIRAAVFHMHETSFLLIFERETDVDFIRKFF